MKLHLPLIERRAREDHSRELAVIYSGDGGWGITERQLAHVLPRRGISVVGVNSFRYFWKARTPEGAAADLSRIIEKYTKEWGLTHVIVMGYSFGADALPFLVNRLPPPSREKVDLVVLLGLGHRADFKFHFSDWFGHPSRDALPILPELEKLRGTPMLCIYGEREKECPCPDLDPSLITSVSRPGGHWILGGWGRIVDHVIAALPEDRLATEGGHGDGKTSSEGRNLQRGRSDSPPPGGRR